MRGADRDEDAGLANFEPAEPMHDGDAVDGEFRVNFGGDFSDFRERHRFVGFVVEIERAPAVRMVAHAAVEGDDGTVFGSARTWRTSDGRVDRVAAEMKKVVDERVGMACRWAELSRR